ncbi:MAG: radical SAM protein, partial [bacterium]|nr:radical SAM protein [bacterium]
MFEAKPTKNTRVAIISLSNPFNIGARHLSSLSKLCGYDTHIIFVGAFLKNDILPPTDVDIELMTDLLVNEIKPDVVGVSVSCSAFFKTSGRITESLRRKGYKGLIAWGGIHSILCHDECIEHCDLAFTGEAENPWVEFLDRVEKGESFADLKGAWVKDSDGTVHKNQLAEFVENLDEVPFPDYDNDRHYYIGEGKLERIEPFRKELYSIFVLSSRGCPFHCSFCATPRIFADLKKEKHIVKYIRQRTVDNVIAEIEYIEESFPNFKASRDGTINFGDDVFVLYKDWVTEFTKKYREKFDRPYWCYFHPNTVNKQIVELLAGTGLKYIDMGIQSGNERVRKELFLRTDT